MAENVAPIIIKKKKGGHGGHHGGAWKVAYADFVTAMMALFIVLWLLSSSEEVQKAVGGYFQDPSGSGKQMGSTMAGSGESLSVNQDNMDQIKEKLEMAMRKVPEFQKLSENVQITVTSEGLRIELMETDKGVFFESGSAKPSGGCKELLDGIAEELSKLPNTVLIEGHTDSKPYASSTGYTNWELSADRANSARRVLQAAGLRADQVAQVRGFADQWLRKPDSPEDPSNRRISIIVQYQQLAKDAADAVEEEKPEGEGASADGAEKKPDGAEKNAGGDKKPDAGHKAEPAKPAAGKDAHAPAGKAEPAKPAAAKPAPGKPAAKQESAKAQPAQKPAAKAAH